MIKADKTILRETKYIAIFCVILSLVMQAVFLVISKWDYTVLLGNLLSAVAAVLNFYYMGISLQKALTKEQEDAKKIMKVSQSSRNLAMFAVIVIGVVMPCFNTVSVILPVFFPRIAVQLRPLVNGRSDK